MSTIIEVKGLSKRFGDLPAVEDLSFQVPAGRIHGFLGQNGAGKSTTIRMLLTLVKPDSGDIRIFGLNIRTHRKEILRNTGAMIERPDLYKYLSALENLEIFARLSGVRPRRNILMSKLEMVGLAARADSRVKTFSQGMKQRLGIAVALVHDPELLILDEPVNGLDPQGIADIRQLILQLGREQKKTIFVSSHLLNEMEQVADSMLIIDKGRKLVEGKAEELFNPALTVVLLQTTPDSNAVKKLEGTSYEKFMEKLSGNSILFRMHRDQVPNLARELVNRDISIISLQATHSLEDYFLRLTSNNNVDAGKH